MLSRTIACSLHKYTYFLSTTLSYEIILYLKALSKGIILYYFIRTLICMLLFSHSSSIYKYPFIPRDVSSTFRVSLFCYHILTCK